MRITWHRKVLIWATLSLLLFLALSNKSFAITEFKLLASDGTAEDAFGVSVSISGDVALVGAENDDDKGTDSGSAYVFRWNGSSWVQEQKLLASDGAADDEFGVSVSISGDVALVGAEGNDDDGSDSGSAYVFRWNGSSWVEEQKLLASDGATDDFFGNSVSISGDVALVGASGNDDNGLFSGSAYVFRWNGSSWVEEQKLVASDGAENDALGFSVSISGGVALVGAPGKVENILVGPGKAYVYDLDGPAAEIIGIRNNGIWYYNVATAQWTQMTADVGAKDIAAGNFNGDGFADVASTWDNFGLFYQDGATLAWTKVDDLPPMRVTAGDITGDGRDEIIGTWTNGIWYYNVAAAQWTQMSADVGAKDIDAGDFNGDGFADVASTWDDFGLWWQNGNTLVWTKVDDLPPMSVTAGDVNGDGRDEIIGTWSNGIWYWDFVASKWTQMTTYATNGDIAAGDFTGDGNADVASIWTDGLWYQDGDNLNWTKVDNSPPFRVTAGDVTGK